MTESIIAFLKDFEPTNDVQAILQTIVLSEVKTIPIEKGAFFQKKRELQAGILSLAKDKYALLVDVVNNGSIEQFAAEIEKVEAKRQQFISEHEMNSISGQMVNKYNTELESLRIFLATKEKYGTLKPLEELMLDEQALMELFT